MPKDDEAMRSIDRTLKQIASELKTQNRILDALNSNLVALVKRLTPPEVIQKENEEIIRLELEKG